MFLKEIGVNVSEINDSGVTLSLIAAGMTAHDRRRKAQRQPRDTSGRWVGAGANVRWRSNGQDWAGTVEKMLDGKAIVKVRHSDGSESMTTLLPNTLKVMASKARLPSVNKKYFDESGQTADYIKKHQDEIAKDAEKGGARIDRPDGYSIDVVPDWKKKKKDKEKDDDGNPLLYQLYAPGGRSGGIYSTPSGVDSAINAGSGHTAPSAPVVSSGIDVVEEAPRAYNLPKAMLTNIAEGIEGMAPLMSQEDLVFFTQLASGEPISYEDVEVLAAFAKIAQNVTKLFGGEEGLEWLTKITAKEKPEISHNFNSGEYEYFVTFNNDNVDLIAVDRVKDTVLSWTGLDFKMDHGSIENFDAERIEPLDNESARKVAEQLTFNMSTGNHTTFSVADLFPEERNLFEMAMTEMDTNYLDTISTLSYNNAERSVDAQRQARGEGGKFGKTSASQKDSKGKYFAIVDTVDPTAVLDVIVVSATSEGPSVYRRAYGSWHQDPDMYTQITGPTPPNVVYLDSEEQIKDVLSQVDNYDLGKEETTEVSEDTEFGLKVLARQFNTTGHHSIEDVHNLITKAKKFNRMDLVPEELRAYRASLDSEGLYGEYGEVLTASAVSLGNSPLQRLENYWLRGEGSKKIDWNSSDSVEYAAKVFTKYLGEDRAYAFATILNSKVSR